MMVPHLEQGGDSKPSVSARTNQGQEGRQGREQAHQGMPVPTWMISIACWTRPAGQNEPRPCARRSPMCSGSRRRSTPFSRMPVARSTALPAASSTGALACDDASNDRGGCGKLGEAEEERIGSGAAGAPDGVAGVAGSGLGSTGGGELASGAGSMSAGARGTIRSGSVFLNGQPSERCRAWSEREVADDEDARGKPAAGAVRRVCSAKESPRGQSWCWTTAREEQGLQTVLTEKALGPNARRELCEDGSPGSEARSARARADGSSSRREKRGTAGGGRTTTTTLRQRRRTPGTQPWAGSLRATGRTERPSEGGRGGGSGL